MQEHKIFKGSYLDDGPKLGIHDTESPIAEGRFALSLVEHWGMVQGTTNQEDSTGRARIDLMEVDEVVDRAFEMAHKTFKKLRDNNLIQQLPTYDEMDKYLEVQKAEKKEMLNQEELVD